MKISALLALSLLAACDALPKDPAGTIDRIRSEKIFTVGTSNSDHRQNSKVMALLQAIAQATGAKAQWRSGSTEYLLQQLNTGEIDLVIGEFSKNSPWSTQASFAPPLQSVTTGKAPTELKAALRNGENRWIMIVEQASRTVADKS